MVVDSHALFCRGNTLFHSEQHISDHVYEDGCAQRRDGIVHQFALSAMGHQTPLESVR